MLASGVRTASRPVQHLDGVTDWTALLADAGALVADASSGLLPSSFGDGPVERVHSLLLIGAVRAARGGDLQAAATCFEAARAVTEAAVVGQSYAGAYLGLRLRVRELAVLAELGMPLPMRSAWGTTPESYRIVALALYRQAYRQIELMQACDPAFVTSAGTCEDAWAQALPMLAHELRAAKAHETGASQAGLDQWDAELRRTSPLAHLALDTKALRGLVAEVQAAERMAAAFVSPAVP